MDWTFIMATGNVCAYDFFDTIVHRKSSPEAVLFQWSRNVVEKLQLSQTAKELYQLRKETEKSIKSNKEKEEVTYETLIGEIYDSLKENSSLHMNKADFINESYRIEKCIELSNIYVDKETIKLITRDYQNKNTIVLITDFYMPTNFFDEVLNNIGIRNVFYKLYVSSDIGLRKSSGNLYKYVLKDLNITSQKLHMYGDNEESDFSIPSKLGIDSELKECNSIDINSTLSVKKLIKYFSFNDNRDSCFQGYLAPSIKFIDKLYHKAKEDGAEQLLFCSREGQLLKKLFDIYQRILYPENSISTEYLYVSRRSTLLPSLADIENEKFERIFRQCDQLTIVDFLFSLGIDYKLIHQILNSLAISDTAIVYNSPNCDTLNRLKRNSIFINWYDKSRDVQRKLFIQYINSLTNSSKKIYLVDIGWKGTIQDNISSILGDEKDIIGYYFGLTNSSSKDNSKKYGLMFDYTHVDNEYKIYTYRYIELEKIFSANHGPVIGYQIINGSVQPVISEDASEIQIYEYVRDWQDLMIKSFESIISYICNSIIEVSDLYGYMDSLYLKQMCIYAPKNYQMYLNFRTKTKENFGNVSGKSSGTDKMTKQSSRINKGFCGVEYVYRALDRYHLKALYPLGNCYCQIVYLFKKATLL